jgi:MFS family permease
MPRVTTEFPVRRNTALLSATMAVISSVLQLVAAVATLTFVLVSGVETLLGLGPAIFLTASALSAFPAGRSMDRFGRIPVLAVGMALGIAGALATGLGTRAGSTVAVIGGFALIGAASATALLVRTAAGDMYPPERRARGIALVLFGSVFGAILGPAVFSPLFAGRELDAAALSRPWLAAAGLLVVALALVLAVRPDPKRIGEAIARARASDDAPPAPAAPLREILGRPGVLPALIAALASFGVMVGVMNLTGYVVVHHHGHHQQVVFPIIGAHVLGMYALVLVVGQVIDRIGRRPALVGGLVLIAVSCAPLLWLDGVWTIGALLFGLGLGWNLSFVAATAELADLTAPSERGKLLGFNDLLAGLLAAALVLLGGVALQGVGVGALALGATALALLPIPLILRASPPPAAALEGA